MNNPLGANWKTSVSGYMETLCAIVIALCVLPADYWSNPRVWVPGSLLVIAKTIKDSLTKDRNVTGGAVQQDVEGGIAQPQAATPAPPKPALPKPPKNVATAILVLLLPCFVIGCGTSPAQIRAYSNAAHTAIHNGLQDAKDIQSVTRDW